MSYWKGKTALITGAGYAALSDGRCGSIGYGIATAFLRLGDGIFGRLCLCRLSL